MQVRKIAIFTRQLNCMGGIERVVIEQVRIFKEHGIDVMLLLEHVPNIARRLFDCNYVVLPQDSKTRLDVLDGVIQRLQPEAVIFHGLSICFAQLDISAFSSIRIPTIVVIHFPFHQTVALDQGYNAISDYATRGAGCAAFATVSAIDAVFWRALGKKAFHVQNPFVHPPKNMEIIRRGGEDGSANLLWVGRLCEQKQPQSALAAFARAMRMCPKVRLTMVGGDIVGIRKLKKYARQLGVLDKVEFVPERPDISEYWAKADIHLLTSICESFCLVWAEAKAAGIPTVMFELPYLELAADKRGYVAVEQQNVIALADAIVDLAQDRKKRLMMGREARESLAPFNDEGVWQSWVRLFDGLTDPIAGTEVDPNLKTIVSQMYAAVCYDKKVYRWPEEMADDWYRLTRTSMRHIASILHRLVSAVRWIKAKIRG